MGICYTRVNTEVVYHTFHSENCKYLLVLEEKLHSQPKYFLTLQKLCKQGLGLRPVLWPHILLYIMIVFLKIRACSIARKCVWHAGVRDCNRGLCSPSPKASVLLLNMMLRTCWSDGAGADVELCGCGILVVLLLSKECTASCLQRAF